MQHVILDKKETNIWLEYDVCLVPGGNNHQGWAPRCASQALALRGSVPESSCKPVVLICWTSHGANPPCGWTEVWSRRKWGKEQSKRESRSVYLLFSSALTARDRLALLNWALNTHIAALKLPDGWEGINSSCRLQELLQTNGTITQVELACVRG